MRLKDRREAGKLLAIALKDLRGREDCVILALPRGGVPVAFDVAHDLGLPMDVLVVRKLGVPGQPELAMGAIAPGVVRVINEQVVDQLGISPLQIEVVESDERRELVRREGVYRKGRGPLDVKGRLAVLVDDGLATGTTMRAAVEAATKLGASGVLVAVPVAAEDSARSLEATGIRLVCLLRPLAFEAVGLWYQDFGQTSDGEVIELMQRSAMGIASNQAVG